VWRERKPPAANLDRPVIQHWVTGRLLRLPQGTGRAQQLRRTTLRHTPARCHRSPP